MKISFKTSPFILNRISLSILLIIGLSSCASIFNWKKNQVVIDSFPKGANVSIDGQEVGQTPCEIKVNKKLFKNQKVRIEKDGYNTENLSIHKKIHGTFWLNAIFVFTPAPLDLLTKRVIYLNDYEFKKLKSKNGLLSPYDSIPDSKYLTMWDKEMPFGTYYFQGKKPKERIMDGGQTQAIAAISSNFIFVFKADSELINLYAFTLMNRKYSWRKKLTSRKLRKESMIHEKGHFDIAEIYCRKFKKAISEAKLNPQTFRQQINDLYAFYKKKLTEAQTRYDKETNHSINEETQKLWLTKISAELDSTSGWENEHFTLPLVPG